MKSFCSAKESFRSSESIGLRIIIMNVDMTARIEQKRKDLCVRTSFMNSIVGGSVGGINPAEPRAENGYFFEDNSAYAISLYNVWIGSISGDLFFTTIFYFILPLAATLPFSFSLSDESKSGYLRQMTLKKGQMKYYFAKYIVTFTSGFLLAAIPLLINVIITACYILQQEKERGALIVLTCHDYSVLKELSDSIYFIEEGRVVGYERQ